MPELPCVIFAFNRPDKLKRVLEALRPQGIERLVVFVDGPRHPGELRQVEACRVLARQVDWAETELHLWEENRGLNGLLENISLVLEQHPWAVFVEDDCLPVTGFYRFMRQALERYQDIPQVFSIGAYQPLPESVFKGYPYSVISGVRFMCWGWATWGDRWQEVLPLARRFDELFDGLQHVPEIAGADIPVVARAVAAGQTKSWATRVLLATLALHKVHLLPVKGLVWNIGTGLKGEHSGRLSALGSLFMQNRNVARQAPDHPIWPEDVSVNCEYLPALKNFHFFSGGNLRRRLALRSRQVLHRLPFTRPERCLGVNLEEKAQPEAFQPALLSYLVDPLLMLPGDPRFMQPVDNWYTLTIVRVLNRMGYLVDVIDHRDRWFIPKKGYKVFIGVSGNFTPISHNLPSETRKVFLSCPNVGTLVCRSGIEEEYRLADAVIVLGDQANDQKPVGSKPSFAVNGISLDEEVAEWYHQGEQLPHQVAQKQVSRHVFAEKMQEILEKLICE
jgi:hypothetical protein